MICVALFRVNFHSTRLGRDLSRIFEPILITELFVVDIINRYFSGNAFILPQPSQTSAWDRAFPFILKFVILSSHE